MSNLLELLRICSVRAAIEALLGSLRIAFRRQQRALRRLRPRDPPRHQQGLCAHLATRRAE